MIDTSPIVRQVARAIDDAVSRAVHGPDSVGWHPGADIKRFREVRDQTLSILGRLTDEQAAWSPGEGSWSIEEIADHLLLSEEVYRDQARRLIRKAEEGKGTILEISLDEMDVGIAGIPQDVVRVLEVPMRMFNLFMPNAVRETIVRYRIVSSLNPRSSQPRHGLILAQLKHDLSTALVQTEEFLAMPVPSNIDELTISHPVLGNNTLGQSFRMLIAHEERHHGQMARVESLAGFPKTSQEPMNAARMAELFGGRK
jgi:uncharacterized damage-inducible protein DinB